MSNENSAALRESKPVITTRTASVTLTEEGIVRVLILPGAEQDLAEATASMAACAIASGGVSRPVLVDFRGMRSQDREARGYYAGPEAARIVSACALVIESPVTRVLANFFMTISKPIIPTRMFTDEAEALEWLRGYLK